MRSPVRSMPLPVVTTIGEVTINDGRFQMVWPYPYPDTETTGPNTPRGKTIAQYVVNGLASSLLGPSWMDDGYRRFMYGKAHT